MSEYLPYSDKHSIQEAQVALQFLSAFGQQEIESARSSIEADFKDILPRSAEIREGSVTLDVSNLDTPQQMGSASASLAGFQFSKVRGDGKLARVLQLSGNVVLIRILDYEIWSVSRADSIKYITAVLEPLSLAGNPVMASSLQFIDRYTFDGKPDAAKADLLFLDGNEYLTTRCFTTGPLWHCHTGWFDLLNGSDRVLNHLNVASTVIDQAPTVTIDHRATLHLATPRQSLDALLTPPDGTLGLGAALDILHDKNKDILKAMLLTEMLDRIGL